MKQLILNVLEDMSGGQINLASEAARRTIANTIMAAIKSNGGKYGKGWFLDLSTLDGEPKLTSEELEGKGYKKNWTCSICGEDTSKVNYDYLVHRRLHLGCALKEEAKGKDIKEQYIEASEGVIERGEDRRKKTFGSTPDRRKNNRREIDWDKLPDGPVAFEDPELINIPPGEEIDGMYFDDEVKEWEEAVGYQSEKYEKEKEKAKQLIDKSVEDFERNKLSEEIVDDKDAGYIYESLDGGTTIYRRVSGSDKKTKIEVVKSS